MSSHHHLTVNTQLGVLHLQATLELSAPWTILYSSSGSGKTSILRSLCGLLPSLETPSSRPKPTTSPSPLPLSSRPESRSFIARRSGEIPVFRVSDNLPPHLRNLAYAPQTPAIFPHLTVRQNVAFPLTIRNLKSEIDDLLNLFALTALSDRLPRDLSGGELQRVNLARALAVPNPTLLILDEPFTGIDRATRNRLIPKLVVRNTPILSVTHDIEEALLIHTAIQTEVIRIDSGRILAQGPAPEVLAPERSQLLETLITSHSSLATP